MWSHLWKLPDKAKQIRTLLHACILQIITFCLSLCVCVSKRRLLKLLYPYKSPPILFPLVLSPHISYQPPPSNSLYLLYCRSLSVFTLLHLPSHSSFLYCCFFFPPSSPSPRLHPPLSLSVCFCNLSVFPIVAVISQIWEGEKKEEERKKKENSGTTISWGFSQLLPEHENASVSLNADAQSN